MKNKAVLFAFLITVILASFFDEGATIGGILINMIIIIIAHVNSFIKFYIYILIYIYIYTVYIYYIIIIYIYFSIKFGSSECLKFSKIGAAFKRKFDCNHF